MIIFDQVNKVYGKDIVALDNVSFTIMPNEFISIVGKSGAGKSTLLKILTGEETVSGGKVLFKNTDVTELKKSQLPGHRRRIGSISQDFRLLQGRTIEENVAFAMEVAGESRKKVREIVPQSLKLVGLAGYEKRFPQELSGGEKQRVAIARALVHGPDLIIADEPTGNLDPVTSWDIVQLLSRINQLAGTAVILATHDKNIIDLLRKRVVLLDRGRLLRDDLEGKYTL